VRQQFRYDPLHWATGAIIGSAAGAGLYDEHEVGPLGSKYLVRRTVSYSNGGQQDRHQATG
jgi:hypothetical protein